MKNTSKLQEFIANPKTSLWKLTIPMMLGLFVNSIYILVDTFFIGSKIGTSAISALGYVMPFYFIVMGITFGLSSGNTTVIAQHIGKGDEAQTNLVAQNSLVMATVISIVNITLVLIFGKHLLLLQGIDPQILELAVEYFYIMAYGSIFLIFGIFIRSILIGEGESMIPMAALGVGTILNIILDPFFIDAWGIGGAAYATVVSQIIVIFIFLYFIFIKKSTHIDLSFKNFHIDFSMWNKIFKIGIPSSLSMLIMSLGLFLMNSIFIDDSHVAAYNLANRIENFIVLALISISTSQVTIIGMFYGAKKNNLIKPMIRYTTLWAILIASFFSIVTFLFIEDIAPLFLTSTSSNEFNMSNEAIQSVVDYYKVMAFAYPFIALTMVSTRAMQAIGTAWPMMLVAFSRVIVMQCILSYIFIIVLGKPIIWAWYAISISCIIASLLAYFMKLYFVNKLCTKEVI